MTPVWRSGLPWRVARGWGMGTPVMALRRSIWVNSEPLVSPPMAVRTAAGNL